MQCPKWEAGVTSIMHTPQIILGDKETSGITHKSTLQWYFDPHLNKIYVVSSFHLNKLQWLLWPLPKKDLEISMKKKKGILPIYWFGKGHSNRQLLATKMQI